jgi:hypothetical protein
VDVVGDDSAGGPGRGPQRYETCENCLECGSWAPKRALCEAIFEQSVAAEKNRGDALSRRFEKALRQRHTEPVTKPTRDFDLD